MGRSNVYRESAGRTLIGFAFLMLLAPVATLQDWWERTELEWVEFPTAVEDRDYFQRVEEEPAGARGIVGEGGGDRVVFWAAPEGLVPSGGKAAVVRDERMRKLVNPGTGLFTRDVDDRVFVYFDEKRGTDAAGGSAEGLFVKVAKDRYRRLRPPGKSGGGKE